MTLYEPEWKDWTIKVLQINISTWCTKGLRKPCRGGSSSTMLKDDTLSHPPSRFCGSPEPPLTHVFRFPDFHCSGISPISNCCHFTFSKEDKNQRQYPSNHHTNKQLSGYFIYFTILSWIKMLWFLVIHFCTLLIVKETLVPKCRYPISSKCHFVKF